MYAANGMPNFSDILSRGEVDDIHAYLIAEQHSIKAGVKEDSPTDTQSE